MNKKSITILVVCLIVSVLSVSFAYYSARIIGDGKNVSVNAKELTINFDNNNEIASGIIEPGWSSTNTFSVTNKSKTNFTYDIVLKNYKNTTKTNGYLVYKITSTNGYNMTEYKDMPKDGENTYDLVIARGITIEPGSSNKQSYTLEIKYLDSTEDQSIDMGSTVTGSLYIVESTTNENNPYTKGTLGYQIMEDNTNIKERTDFSKVYTDTNIGTMYKAQEDNTDVYYFAGDARNNWVKFGGYYWRIIRTNSDGSVRLLYHGTSSETENAYIGDGEIAFNESYNDSMYVGYMYGTSGSLENNRLNTNDSTIKKTIDAWYKDNLVNYTKYLSTSAVYCNDRELGSGTYSATGDKFYYVGYTRLGANKNPSYNCTNEYDAFSVNNTKAQLTYPIALMTADEISYAGGVWIKNAATWYYLNSKGSASIKNGQNEWWLLSAASWDTDKSSVVFKVSSSQDRKAQFGAQSVQYKLHVRPVISLKKDLLYKSGDGSATSPYEVVADPVNMYTVSLIVNNGSGTSTVLVEESKDATFTVTPNDGYKAELETDTCGGTLSGNTYTISNVTSNKTCSITFKKKGTSLAALIQTNAVNEKGYRYEGANPNNYIYMVKNGSNELWRIIGLFPDGTSGENVIRVRKVGYESAQYDSNSTNHWPKTTLYTTLSSTYSIANYKNTVNYTMYLGTNDFYTSYTSANLYDMERILNNKGMAGKTSSSSYSSTTTFIGSVGLMYPSDYGYAVLASDCARTTNPYSYDGTSSCHNNNWLYQGSSDKQWLISPHTSYDIFAFGVDVSGNVYTTRTALVTNYGYFSPVMALKSDVTVSGSGTQSDPYVMTN